jgi:hypothetical protein
MLNIYIVPMPRPKTGNPVGRPPGARNRGSPAQRMGAALAARQYSADAIRFLAKVMYDPKADWPQRIRAANRLLDLAHGKPKASVETPDPQEVDKECRTIEEIIAEIKRRGYDKVLDLTKL